MALKIRLTILGFWFGAMTTFSAVVAPAAFAVLPSQILAGSLVSRTLSMVEYIGIAVGLILIAIASASVKQSKLRISEQLLLAVMTLSMVISHFVISARLHEIRLQTGNRLETMPATDPLRVDFQMLHQFSVGLMAFNMTATLILIFVLTWRSSSSPKAVRVPKTELLKMD
jgi:hypothetical protein